MDGTPQITSNVFNLGTVEGILVVLFVGFLLWHSSKKVVGIISGILFLFVVFQIMYGIGQSDLNRILNIAGLFHYDAFTYLANLIPGTKIAEFILQAGSFINGFTINFGNWVASYISNIPNLVQDATTGAIPNP